MDDPAPEKPSRSFSETIEVTGNQLVDKVKDLVNSGNVRTLRIHAGDDFLLEMPVTVGVIAGGVMVLAAPWLAVLGVIAAMVAKVRIEVERDGEDAPAEPGKDATAPEKTDA